MRPGHAVFILATVFSLAATARGQERVPFFSPVATPFDPEISIVNTGIVSDMQVVVSPDNKYVTINARRLEFAAAGVEGVYVSTAICGRVRWYECRRRGRACAAVDPRPSGNDSPRSAPNFIGASISTRSNMAENAPPKNPNDPASSASAPKPKRRRRWPLVVLSIVLLLILLVLFAPMIASTAPVRSFVVGKINENLNGKVEIHSWSIGWTGGIVVNGVRVVDDKGVQILQVEKLSTQLSLIDAMRGKLDFGKTSAQGTDFNLYIDKEGHSNFERLAKTSTKPKTEHAPAPHEKSETKLPDLSIDFTSDLRGTIQQEGQPTVYLDPSKISAKIPNINAPITHDIDLRCAFGDGGTPGKVRTRGDGARNRSEPRADRQTHSRSERDAGDDRPRRAHAVPQAREGADGASRRGRRRTEGEARGHERHGRQR